MAKESSSYQSRYNKLTKEDFERLLGMPASDLCKGCHWQFPGPTERAHQLGMFYSHISSRKISIQVKFGIANSEADGGGDDKGIVIVDFNLPVADVIKKIEGRWHLTPGTYTLEYFAACAFGEWWRLESDMDWHTCLSLHKGKKFIELRGLMRPPAPLIQVIERDPSLELAVALGRKKLSTGI